MKRILICLFAAAAIALTALAADLSGKWTGSLRVEGGGGSETATLVLKQEGTSITGSAGPDEGEQWPIQNGKIDGSRISIEVKSEEHGTFKLELVLDGDHLKGDLTGMHDGEPVKAKMDLTRAK